MSDYFEMGEEFLEHFGVKGMKWGKTTKSAPTAKGDFARAALGGPILAPESTSRTAKRAVKPVKDQKAKRAKRKANRTPEQKEKIAERKRTGKGVVQALLRGASAYNSAGQRDTARALSRDIDRTGKLLERR